MLLTRFGRAMVKVRAGPILVRTGDILNALEQQGERKDPNGPQRIVGKTDRACIEIRPVLNGCLPVKVKSIVQTFCKLPSS